MIVFENIYGISHAKFDGTDWIIMYVLHPKNAGEEAILIKVSALPELLQELAEIGKILQQSFGRLPLRITDKMSDNLKIELMAAQQAFADILGGYYKDNKSMFDFTKLRDKAKMKYAVDETPMDPRIEDDLPF
jgi:hypothetical protein